ncbi:Alpha/Beta hydrolase protein [Paraphysoderma sedebokerense]|nr:Alpha/Beta hydrolase protein [Paraphysoderma sedebokerense]
MDLMKSAVNRAISLTYTHAIYFVGFLNSFNVIRFASIVVLFNFVLIKRFVLLALDLIFNKPHKKDGLLYTAVPSSPTSGYLESINPFPDDLIYRYNNPCGVEGYDYQPNYLSYKNLRIHYIDISPSAPSRKNTKRDKTLLFVHGNPSWSFLFRHVIDSLDRKNEYRLVAIDLPGFGKSDRLKYEELYNVWLHLGTIWEVIQQLDLKGLVLVGHDWGAVLVLHLIGILSPKEIEDRISGLVVLDGGLPPHPYPSEISFPQILFIYLWFLTIQLFGSYTPLSLSLRILPPHTFSQSLANKYTAHTTPFNSRGGVVSFAKSHPLPFLYDLVEVDAEDEGEVASFGLVQLMVESFMVLKSWVPGLTDVIKNNEGIVRLSNFAGEKIKRESVKCLVMYGELDELLKGLGEAVGKKLKSEEGELVRVRRVPRAGHHSPEDNPGYVSDCIENFVKDL